jgi:hypothetical protein
MLADIIIRAIAIARVRGCGWWLIGAFWGTLFHIAVAPVQWTMEKGHTVGKNIGYQMDAEAARTAEDDPEAQGLNPEVPRQLSAPRGPLNNLDRLVNWSHEFLNRNQDARIYPARPRDARGCRSRGWEPRSGIRERQRGMRIQPVDVTSAPSQSGECAAHIGMGGMRIEKEPRQRDEYVHRTS